jgi:hypothetical protein
VRTPLGYDAEPLSRIVTDQTPGPQYESELAPGGFQTLQTDAGRVEPRTLTSPLTPPPCVPFVVLCARCAGGVGVTGTPRG